MHFKNEKNFARMTKFVDYFDDVSLLVEKSIIVEDDRLNV